MTWKLQYNNFLGLHLKQESEKSKKSNKCTNQWPNRNHNQLLFCYNVILFHIEDIFLKVFRNWFFHRMYSICNNLRFRLGWKFIVVIYFSISPLIKTEHVNIALLVLENIPVKDTPNIVLWRLASQSRLVIQWSTDLLSLWLYGLVVCFILNLLIDSFK